MTYRDAFAILHTADLARAVAFYVERLGFEERYRFGNFAVVGLETFDLGLTEVEEVEPAGRAALWLYTDDANAEIDRLRAAEVEVVREPADMEWGERMGSVRDPDGNELFIGQRL
jgi:catechol 2,3-dioxygenase-like lactoylglutathione lyase family enzyme